MQIWKCKIQLKSVFTSLENPKPTTLELFKTFQTDTESHITVAKLQIYLLILSVINFQLQIIEKVTKPKLLE